jgi:uncharacterized protein YjbJ (UPF0337 family)
MTACIKDKALGTLHQVTGMIKEVASKLFQNSSLAVDGRIEKSRGKVQEQVGQAKKVFGK